MMFVCLCCYYRTRYLAKVISAFQFGFPGLKILARRYPNALSNRAFPGVFGFSPSFPGN